MSYPRQAAVLAINLLFIMLWGFAGIGKVINGVPPWFADKFGQTFFARFPGLAALFWLLTAAELLALGLALASLVRGEFLGRRPARYLTAMLVWSLFVFIQLGFGQWLTAEYNGAFQIFTYFGVTLIALQFVASTPISAGDRERS